VSGREPVKSTVKVTLTGSDGRVLKVIEGENPDPFSYSFISILQNNITGPTSSITIYDPFGNSLSFDFVTPSPSTSLGYLAASFCLTNCPNAGSTPPNGPGIWLFNVPPAAGISNGWPVYSFFGIPSPYLIAGLSYSPLAVSTGSSTPSSPGDVVYGFDYATQSITNTLSSPVNIYTVTLVGAVYGSLSASPVYIPITFYVFTPPIVLSPGVTMTVSITLSFPYGIAGSKTSSSGTIAL
jgi:hypothetical protein